MPKLPALTCWGCGRLIESREYGPNTSGGRPRATDYGSCLRKCEACGFGYSNAETNDIHALTVIYRDPFWDVPRFIAEGYEKALGSAPNEANRAAKLQKFSSSNSEDHVTWTIFRHLVETGGMGETARQLGMADAAQGPAVFLWGVPITPENSARRELIAELERLGERPERRSEPDVILDFNASGLVFIEVKLRSSNDTADADQAHWNRYVEGSDAFTDGKKARETGLYELTRNWRILYDLAGSRPATLVNLGPSDLSVGRNGERIASFESALATNRTRRFMKISWDEFLNAIPNKPVWLRRYVQERFSPRTAAS